MWIYEDFQCLCLTLADGVCCAWFIFLFLSCCCWPEIGTSSIDWAQLSRCHLKTETESSLRNVVNFVVKTRRWIMSRHRRILLVNRRHKALNLIPSVCFYRSSNYSTCALKILSRDTNIRFEIWSRGVPNTKQNWAQLNRGAQARNLLYMCNTQCRKSPELSDVYQSSYLKGRNRKFELERSFTL
jgi:hypothetical protein